MHDTPLVSFILYTRNTEPSRLRECIESITSLSLSWREREIIVMDDASDSTPLNGLSDCRDQILYIRLPYSGLAVARNMGLKMASGRFVQFLEADGRLIRAPYEHCLDIARYHNPDIVLFKTTTRENNADVPFTYDGPENGSKYMCTHSLDTNNRYLFKQTMLGRLRFTEGSTSEEDDFMPQLLLRSEQLFTTDSKAYLKTPTERTITEDEQERFFNDTERALAHLQALVVPETDRAALQRQIAQLTMGYLQSSINRTRSRRQLEDAAKRLQAKGLYPLPDRNYSKQYTMFRKMMANGLTRRLLFLFN